MKKPNMKAVKVYLDRQRMRTKESGTKIKGKKNLVGDGC